MTSERDGDARAEIQAETERLAQLRYDVAAGLLELSKSAKSDAERLLAGIPDEHDLTSATTMSVPAKSWLYGVFALGVLCGLIVAMLIAPGDEVPPPQQAEAESTPAPREVAPTASPPQALPGTAPPGPPVSRPPVQARPTADIETEPPPEPTIEPPSLPEVITTPAEQLVVSITATGACWVSARLDGASAPIERLLAAQDTLVLEATEEAVLRIGDPAAISMSINGRPTRPLGSAGRVVNLRITPNNFQTFLN